MTTILYPEEVGSKCSRVSLHQRSLADGQTRRVDEASHAIVVTENGAPCLCFQNRSRLSKLQIQALPAALSCKQKAKNSTKPRRLRRRVNVTLGHLDPVYTTTLTPGFFPFSVSHGGVHTACENDNAGASLEGYSINLIIF